MATYGHECGYALNEDQRGGQHPPLMRKLVGVPKSEVGHRDPLDKRDLALEERGRRLKKTIRGSGLAPKRKKRKKKGK